MCFFNANLTEFSRVRYGISAITFVGLKKNHLLGSKLCYLCALMLHFENNLPVSGGCVYIIWTVILSRAGLARGKGVKPNRNVCNRFAKIGFSLVLGGGSRLFHAKALSPRTYVCPTVYFTLKNALRGRTGCFYFFNVFYFPRCGDQNVSVQQKKNYDFFCAATVVTDF